MPTTGGRNSSLEARSIGLVKRCLAGIFVAVGLMFALDQLGFRIGSLSALVDAQRSLPTRSVTSSDCSFLREPESFRGVQARHRRQVSDITAAVSSRLENGQEARMVPPEEMPRKNYIDDILFGRMGQAGIQSASLSSDAEFLRRVTIDLTGRIPSPQDVTQFLGDSNPNKRDALVDALINSPEFVDKWTLFYGDLFKNSAFATNINLYINNRESFHKFISDSIAQNKSYAQIATEMISATGDTYSNGALSYIVLGNVPMGPIQDTYDGLAVQASTIFLGIGSMDCLLCHDGRGHLDAVNLWGSQQKRADAWGMAAFFARSRRTFERASQTVNYGIYRVTEAATGEYQLNTNSGNRQTRAPINGKATVDPNYMFGGGGVANGENRRQALARLITSDKQFARAAVNYLWEELMVEALVSPSNTFDLARIQPGAQLPDGWAPQPSNPELLEALAVDFINSGYNIRHVIATIAKSNAYGLSSFYFAPWKPEYVPYYARKFVRRLDGEEIHDAIVKATGILPVTTYRDAGAAQNTTIIGFPVMSDEGVKVREVQWAMQLPEPVEPRQNAASASFMNSFLRGNRDAVLRSGDASILQSLNMMNNTFVRDRIHQANRITNVPNTPEIPSTVRRLLGDSSLTNDQIITQLFLYTLSRYPTEEEKAKIQPYFSSMTKQAATESLQWVLLNKVDFIFNY